MFYEAVSRRTIKDQNGNDKRVSEKFIVNNCELCAEVEQKMLEEYNGENDVTLVKESNLMEFVNERTDDEQFVFLSKLENTFVGEDGEEKVTTYSVALFAKDMEEAHDIMKNYSKQGLDDLKIVSIKKTKIVDLINYNHGYSE